MGAHYFMVFLGRFAQIAFMGFRFYRVSNWCYLTGFCLIGIFYSGQPSSIVLFIVATAISSFSLAYLYSVNSCFDIETDRETGVDNLISQGAISFRQGCLLSAFPLMMAVLFSLLVATGTFPFLLIALAIGTAYSAPPIRLKAVPVLCTIVNGATLSLLFLVGYTSFSALTLGALQLFIYLCLLEMPSQLVHEMIHSEADKKQKVNTTALKLGSKRTVVVASLMLLSSIPVAGYMYLSHLISSPLFVAMCAFPAITILLFLRRYDSQSLEAMKSLRKKYRNAGVAFGLIFVFILMFVKG